MKRILLSILALNLTGCQNLTPAQQSLIDSVAAAVAARAIQEIGAKPVKVAAQK